MDGLAKYFIVEASAMPEIYRKVAQAKRLLDTGEETTVNAAARAVGINVGRNPLPLLLPCHRVVGSHGTLTGYAGGVELKKSLLELEKKFANP